MLTAVVPCAIVVASAGRIVKNPKDLPISLADALKRSPNETSGGTFAMTVVPKSFSAEDWKSVQDFLSSHPDVMSALPEVRKYVSKAFSPGCTVDLEVQVDHTEGYSSLVARVQFDGDADEALDRFDDLGSDWWYAAGAKFHGTLVMDVEFA